MSIRSAITSSINNPQTVNDVPIDFVNTYKYLDTFKYLGIHTNNLLNYSVQLSHSIIRVKQFAATLFDCSVNHCQFMYHLFCTKFYCVLYYYMPLNLVIHI